MSIQLRQTETIAKIYKQEWLFENLFTIQKGNLHILLQIFLKFKTPFWTRKENNLAEPIVLGKLPISNQNSSIWMNNKENQQKTGAIGITDGHLKQVQFFNNIS